MKTSWKVRSVWSMSFLNMIHQIGPRTAAWLTYKYPMCNVKQKFQMHHILLHWGKWSLAFLTKIEMQPGVGWTINWLVLGFHRIYSWIGQLKGAKKKKTPCSVLQMIQKNNNFSVKITIITRNTMWRVNLLTVLWRQWGRHPTCHHSAPCHPTCHLSALTASNQPLII